MLAQAGGLQEFFSNIGASLGGFLPSLIGAIVFLIVGWLLATTFAAIVRKVLKSTDLDNRLAGAIAGDSSLPVAQWASVAVFWIVMLFAIIGALNVLKLEVVSGPLNSFLDQIFAYLPKLGGAAILLGIGWLLATAVKMLVVRVLGQFRLDDRLAEQSGGGASPIPLNETLGNVLFWLILFFFLPAVLGALELEGPLEPVQDLLNDILAALPNVLKAAIIIGIAWLVSRIVRGIVSNLLAATGVDRLGERFGLSGTTTVSSLAGTILYALILSYAALEALKALQLEAVTGPIILMLERIYDFVPQVAAAGAILAITFFIGRLIARFISSFLTDIGFNNIYSWLGLPPLSLPTPAATGDSAEPPQPKTPAEIVGTIVLIAIMFFAAVAAAETLQLGSLTNVIQATFRISARVLSGAIVFAIGLYFANLAFRLIQGMGMPQSGFLAQAARITILTFVGAMALQQMGVATNIVNLAFGLLLGAIAVAIALAFGFGGREIAAEQIRKWLDGFQQE